MEMGNLIWGQAGTLWSSRAGEGIAIIDALSVRKMDIGDVDREECTEEAADVAGEDEPAFVGDQIDF